MDIFFGVIKLYKFHIIMIHIDRIQGEIMFTKEKNQR